LRIYRENLFSDVIDVKKTFGEITKKIEKVKFFQDFAKKSSGKVLIKRIKSIHLPIKKNNPGINDDYPYPKIIDNNQSLKHKV